MVYTRQKKDGLGFHCSESSIRAEPLILPFHRPNSKGDSSAYVYDMGTRIVTELLLEAEDLLLEMPKNEVC